MKIRKDIKVEFNKDVKSLKKTQTEIKVEIEYLGYQIKSSEVSLTNRLQGMKERLSGRQGSPVKENVKSKKIWAQNIQEN